MNRIEEISAWLHLTDRCNLKCQYCYLPHNPIDMPLNIAFSSIDAIFRVANKYNSSIINIKYMGGEPLIVYQNIISISNYTKSLAKQNNIELKEGIISNGILLNKQIIEELKRLNIRLTISLDGLGKYNTQRVDNRLTDRVLRAIELSIENRLSPHISIVISEKNIEGLPAFVSWLLKKRLKFNFNLVRNSDFFKDIKLKEQKIIGGLLKTFDVIEENLPKYNIVNSMFSTLDPLLPHKKSCGVGENYLVFNPKGEIAKCQMEIDNIVATYRSDDPIKKIREDRSFVKSYNVDEIEECKECDIRYFCTGGCPIQSYYVTGFYNRKSPYCNIYKAIYPSLLRLEGLRVLELENR